MVACGAAPNRTLGSRTGAPGDSSGSSEAEQYAPVVTISPSGHVPSFPTDPMLAEQMQVGDTKSGESNRNPPGADV
jgi:hypothetical protein